ncbi:hypothetical protein P7K49_015113 [Saguinus oedipus]|uniref:Basic proline-rich protein-like n=1 Tax=Saguinus oedipus TaxID=9490 RepID=A0ABQ9V8A8_SAGOE|nr:hypothetical protein P7K49_015113 [Saguinus oedipus]
MMENTRTRVGTAPAPHLTFPPLFSAPPLQAPGPFKPLQASTQPVPGLKRGSSCLSPTSCSGHEIEAQTRGRRPHGPRRPRPELDRRARERLSSAEVQTQSGGGRSRGGRTGAPFVPAPGAWRGGAAALSEAGPPAPPRRPRPGPEPTSPARRRAQRRQRRPPPALTPAAPDGAPEARRVLDALLELHGHGCGGRGAHWHEDRGAEPQPRRPGPLVPPAPPRRPPAPE